AMGQLRPIKGNDILVDAFIQLCQMTDRPVRLDIAGTGGQKEMLQQKIDAAGLVNRCRLIGAVPRDGAPAFMNGCDCFVCPSRMEMLSTVLMECAACGKPAVATRCGGPEAIVTPDTGILVEKENPAALAAGMLEMMDNIAAYNPAVIRAHAMQTFGADTVAALLHKACEDAAKSEK
ncbi:MAG: glycosyltransferase, partial [Oscillospiraceae bacterium]|nr:glycosyltransferase [Oscillospiraceae bacterium]